MKILEKIKKYKFIILKIFIFILVLFLIIFFNIFDLNKNQNGIILKIKENKKPLIKTLIKKISGKVYQETTIHNPEGDMFPDWIDDKIKEEIKNRVE